MVFLLDNHVWVLALLVIAFFIYNFVDSKNGKLNMSGDELMKRYIYLESLRKSRKRGKYE